MKFNLIAILMLCAFAARPSQQNSNLIENDSSLLEDDSAVSMSSGLEGKFYAFLDYIVSGTEATYDELKASANNAVLHMQERFDEILHDAEDTLVHELNEALDQLEEIEDKMSDTKNCLSAYRPMLSAAMDKAKDDVKNCYSASIAKTDKFSDGIQTELNAVRGTVASLKSISNSCVESSTNPLNIIRCITKRSKEINENIFQLFDNVKDTISASMKLMLDVIEENELCTDKEMGEASAELNSIVADTKKCFADNKLDIKEVLAKGPAFHVDAENVQVVEQIPTSSTQFWKFLSNF